MHHRQFALVVLVVVFAGCGSSDKKTVDEIKNETASKNNESANQSNQNSAEDYYRRGLKRGKNGELDKAIAEFNGAIRLNPKFAWPNGL